VHPKPAQARPTRQDDDKADSFSFLTLASMPSHERVGANPDV